MEWLYLPQKNAYFGGKISEVMAFGTKIFEKQLGWEERAFVRRNTRELISLHHLGTQPGKGLPYILSAEKLQSQD